MLLDVYICKAQSNIISVEVKGSGEETGKISAPDRTYYLLADSREEMETWHKNICEVAGLQLCRKNNGTFLSCKRLLGSYLRCV